MSYIFPWAREPKQVFPGLGPPHRFKKPSTKKAPRFSDINKREPFQVFPGLGKPQPFGRVDLRKPFGNNRQSKMYHRLLTYTLRFVDMNKPKEIKQVFPGLGKPQPLKPSIKKRPNFSDINTPSDREPKQNRVFILKLR